MMRSYGQGDELPVRLPSVPTYPQTAFSKKVHGATVRFQSFVVLVHERRMITAHCLGPRTVSNTTMTPRFHSGDRRRQEQECARRDASRSKVKDCPLGSPKEKFRSVQKQKGEMGIYLTQVS